MPVTWDNAMLIIVRPCREQRRWNEGFARALPVCDHRDGFNIRLCWQCGRGDRQIRNARWLCSTRNEARRTETLDATADQCRAWPALSWSAPSAALCTRPSA